VTTLTWVRREPPLAAAALLARDGAVAALAERLADDAHPERFRAAGADGWLLIIADAAALPWAPSLTYLGWDGPMLLPTTHRPTLPIDLIGRSLRRSHPGELTVLLPDAVLTTRMPSRPVDIVALTALAAGAG
jgi:hypothetical protein